MIRRSLIGIFLVSFLGYLLAGLVLEMPEFGSPNAPAYIQTIPRYLENSIEDTGATNIVASIILDYRAYDTLGEATVLFTAALAILSLVGRGE